MLKYVQKIAPPDTRPKQEGFHCAKNQTLAPQHNKEYLDKFNKEKFDEIINKQLICGESGVNKNELYLEELKSRSRIPHRQKREIRPLRPHLLQFHTDIRPPYWGTWQKKSRSVTGRRPFGQDEEIFDYEVDSEAEWDIGGPGESLCGDDDDEEDDLEEDNYEIDMKFFVPHGYVSDDEVNQGSDQEDVVDVESENDVKTKKQSQQNEDEDVVIVYDGTENCGEKTESGGPKSNHTKTGSGRFELKPIVLGLTFNDNNTIASAQKIEFLKIFEAGLC